MPARSFVRRLQSQLLRIVQPAFQRGKTSSNGQGILGGDTIAPEDIAAGPSPRFSMRVANAGRRFGFCQSQLGVDVRRPYGRCVSFFPSMSTHDSHDSLICRKSPTGPTKAVAVPQLYHT